MTRSPLSGPEQPPASGGKAKQLVILLHGLGADGNDLIGLAPDFAGALPDAHFISPNAPVPCDMAPFGHQWFSLRDPNPARWLDGVKLATPILNDFIDAQLEAHGLADGDMALAGFSQGTMMALYTALRRPRACAGVLGYSGALIAPELLATELKSRPAVCLVHGAADQVVPFSCMPAAESALAALDVPVEAHARPGLPHGIDGEGIAIGKAFLKRIFA
ncbi:MAG: dienelactone hydrolase family protein [Alphaproteobacteria bacterium]|nr:dienelactone hydrolase family protein [Alphaproteobacteria bacterium]